ncbi:MAG: FtsX-like permease family protein [Cyclobacteriaceae bacterium]
MIRFLLKGILNDKSRSVLPVIVVSIGVALTVLLNCWLKGVMGESIMMNANFSTGHVKVMTRAYAGESGQMPNDLAILGVDSLTEQLKDDYPDIDWVKRIRFGGLIDFPDEKGETRAQGPVVGWAIDLLSDGSREANRFNIRESLVTGTVPNKTREALITHDFAEKLKVKPGDEFTFFGTTMEGGMAFRNFIVSGTVRFGSIVLDRGAVIVNISDAQQMLGMQDAAGEILGYFGDAQYDHEKATEISSAFNGQYNSDTDEYSPTMLRLKDQGGMSEYMDYSSSISGILIFVFVLAMSIVLWNAGLLGGLRRYKEFGVRLALGEEKKHLFKTLIYEGVMIGAIGSVFGTGLGLAISYYLQEVGIDISGSMQNSTLMMPSVVRASVSPSAFYIGFIPGLFAMVLGNALSGLGIYRRKTAQLFKELEV